MSDVLPLESASEPVESIADVVSGAPVLESAIAVLDPSSFGGVLVDESAAALVMLGPELDSPPVEPVSVSPGETASGE